MHELSLAENVLQIIEEAAQAQGFSRVKTVVLEIGRPAAVEPVKVSRPTPGWRMSASPASSPSPATTLITPGGIPARATWAAQESTEHAACSAAFTTTVFPAASAAPTFADISDSGAFHGIDTG